MRQSTEGVFDGDFSEFLDWDLVKAGNLPDINYKIQNKSTVLRRDTGTIDIFKTIQNSHSLIIKNPNEQVRLKLGAKE
jgi:hypothetical protein